MAARAGSGLPGCICHLAAYAGQTRAAGLRAHLYDLLTSAGLPDLLPAGLFVIRNGGVSHGAHMLADPALDLSDPAERGEQADRWLIQMAADAGLLGMETLVSKLRDNAELMLS